MKKKITIPLLMFQATLALAGGDGSGVRGGLAIRLNNRPVLLELARNFHSGACQSWKRGDEFLQTLPGSQQILQSIRETHWILAETLIEEARSLHVCLTGKLKRIPKREQDGVSIVPWKNVEQVAVRFDDLDTGKKMIFIDKGTFEDMPSTHQTFTLTHELLHGLIRSSDLHITYVRSMNLALETNYRTRIPKNVFRQHIELNEVAVPAETTPFDSKRVEITRAISPNSDTWARIQSTQKVGLPDLNQLPPILTSSLFKWIDTTFLGFAQMIERDELAQMRTQLEKGLDPTFEVYQSPADESMRLSLIDLALLRRAESPMVQLLSKYIPEGSTFSSAQRLIWLALTKDLKSIDLTQLLEKGSNPNYRSNYRGRSRSLLSLSVEVDRKDVFEKLITEGNLERSTALEAASVAIERRNGRAIAYLAPLYERGLLTVENSAGQKKGVLEMAVDEKNPSVFQDAMNRGADPNARFSDNRSPFEAAIEAEEIGIVSILIGANEFEWPDFSQHPWTARRRSAVWLLHSLTHVGNQSAVERLLSQHSFDSADLYFAWQLANQNKKTEVAALLKTAWKESRR
jgi:hypothetical protein